MFSLLYELMRKRKIIIIIQFKFKPLQPVATWHQINFKNWNKKNVIKRSQDMKRTVNKIYTVRRGLILRLHCARR